MPVATSRGRHANATDCAHEGVRQGSNAGPQFVIHILSSVHLGLPNEPASVYFWLP
jgi:hypothetical protein